MGDEELMTKAAVRRTRLARELCCELLKLGSYSVDEVAPRVAELLEEFMYEFLPDE